MATSTELAIAKEYAVEAKDRKGRPGWYEKKDPSVNVAPHHQEAAKYGESSHVRGRKGITSKERKEMSSSERLAVDTTMAGEKVLRKTPVVGTVVKRIPTKTLVETSKSSPIGALGRKDLTIGQKGTRFVLATATSGLSSIYYAKKDKKAGEAVIEKPKLKPKEQIVGESDAYIDAQMKKYRKLGANLDVGPAMESVWKQMDDAEKEEGNAIHQEWIRRLDAKQKEAKSRGDQEELRRIEIRRAELEKSYLRWYGRK